MASFNSITRGLRRMVTKLERLKETNDAKIEKDSAEIDALCAQISVLNAEGVRAESTAKKLKEIIGDPV